MKKPTKFLVPIAISREKLAKLNAEAIAGGYEPPTSMGTTLGYKKRGSPWTVWMAVREFVQNSFDVITQAEVRHVRGGVTVTEEARQALSSVKLEYDSTKKIGYIIDQGRGIKYRNLFFDEDKGDTGFDVACLRGRFGEGMKLGLLPLLRGDHKVMIRTVGADYHFTTVPSADGTFSLVYMIQIPNTIKKGTCVAISGVDPNKFRTNFVPFIEKDTPEKILLTATAGCAVRQAINLPAEAAGGSGPASHRRATRQKEWNRLYIRDIFVENIGSFFSYNFWFDDTPLVLDSNRNQLTVNSDSVPIQMEFGHLLNTLVSKDPDQQEAGLQFWTVLLGKMYEAAEIAPQRGRRGKPQDKFEWAALDDFQEYTEGDEDTDSFQQVEESVGKALFSIISDIVGTTKFSWSSNYNEGRALEHFSVLDLRDKLPNLYGLLSEYIQSPEQWKELDELRDKVVVLPLETFYSVSAPFGRRVAALHKSLSDMGEIMLIEADRDDIAESLKLYFYTGDFTEGAEGVAGYYSPVENAIYIHAKYLQNETSQELVKTFIHEMSHAYCEGCEDITEEFENALEEMAFQYQYYSHGAKEIQHGFWDLRKTQRRRRGRIRVRAPLLHEKFEDLLAQTSSGIEEEIKKRKEYTKSKKPVVEKDVVEAKKKRKKKAQERKVLSLLNYANFITEGTEERKWAVAYKAVSRGRGQRKIPIVRNYPDPVPRAIEIFQTEPSFELAKRILHDYQQKTKPRGQLGRVHARSSPAKRRALQTIEIEAQKAIDVLMKTPEGREYLMDPSWGVGGLL